MGTKRTSTISAHKVSEPEASRREGGGVRPKLQNGSVHVLLLLLLLPLLLLLLHHQHKNKAGNISSQVIFLHEPCK
jgi:hypothetical protein